MENIDNGKKTGRPRQQYKKIHIPGIVIYEDTVKKIKIIANDLGCSQSEVYQEALDKYIWEIERKKTIISL